MARIVTVYRDSSAPFVPVDMSLIRWLKMSEALARLGHRVDIATGEPELRERPAAMAPRLRRVSLDRIRWDEYDMVKTLFHLGFETLERRGGLTHSFLVSKLGSVVGSGDVPGVYFEGARRQRLFEIQQRIAERGAAVALLTKPSADLWRASHGDANRILLVPGATEASVQEPGPDPYPDRGGYRRCVYSGNIYDASSQSGAHRTLVSKLNALGAILSSRRTRLYVAGAGDASGLDPECVTHLGAVPYARSWDYLWHADVGLVLAFGQDKNHNESTKIYYYLRTGLPVVCEEHYPNQNLIAAARLGRTAPNGDTGAIAACIEDCLRENWDRDFARELMIREHTWDRRARIYGDLLSEAGFGQPVSGTDSHNVRESSPSGDTD